MYKIIFAKSASKNIPRLKAANLADKTKKLIEIISDNPFQNPPPYEKLVGNMANLYSRRINVQHRLVYEVLETDKIIKIVSVWSHYEF